MNSVLDDLRRQLDQVDEEIVALVARRLELCIRAGHVKRQTGLPMMQPDRVEKVKAHASSIGEQVGLNATFVADLFQRIVDEACRLECEVQPSGPSEIPPESVLAQRAKRIDHVAIAVRDLDVAIESYRSTLGFHLIERRRIDGSFSGMDSAVMRAGGVTIVLVQGTSAESNVSKYVAQYGPGVQHLAIELDDLEAARSDLVARRCDILTGVIRGAGLLQMFTRREPNSGMQFEFVSRTTEIGFQEENARALFEAMEREDVF